MQVALLQSRRRIAQPYRSLSALNIFELSEPGILAACPTAMVEPKESEEDSFQGALFPLSQSAIVASHPINPLRDWEDLRPLFLDDASFRRFIELHQRDLAATGEVQICLGQQSLGRLLGPESTREYAFYRSFRRIIDQAPEDADAADTNSEKLSEWVPGRKQPRPQSR